MHPYLLIISDLDLSRGTRGGCKPEGVVTNFQRAILCRLVAAGRVCRRPCCPISTLDSAPLVIPMSTWRIRPLGISKLPIALVGRPGARRT